MSELVRKRCRKNEAAVGSSKVRQESIITRKAGQPNSKQFQESILKQSALEHPDLTSMSACFIWKTQCSPMICKGHDSCSLLPVG